MPQHDDDLLRRAARLYRIPGVHAAEVCERLGLSRHALAKARKHFDPRAYPWPRDLVLSALTDAGKRSRGSWPTRDQLATLASYVDFVNKDGSTVETIEQMLDELVSAEILRRDAEGFELLQPFP